MYDAYGRLAQKGGSTYTYGTNHPHAATSAHGWTYNYNDNGDVTSKTDGVDTYTFTYTRELKIATISLNSQVLHRFGYDANGNRVAERRSDGTLVFSVGGYYEYSQKGAETHTRLYYGSEALRVDGELRFILTDHLGSTAVVTDEIGEYLAEQRYDAWGLTRYVDGVIPTDKEYTRQRHSRDIGLYDYKARWYDPLLGRFLMEDTIIPNQGVMKLDRYAYVNNVPVFAVDPSGHLCFDVGGTTVCSNDTDSTGWWVPVSAPDELEDEELWDYWTSKETQVSGQDYYELYRELWLVNDGWWWKVFGADGTFSVWDFIQLILYIEADRLSIEFSNNPAGVIPYIEGLVRSAHGWGNERVKGKLETCTASSPACALNWLAGYSQSGASRLRSWQNGANLNAVFSKPEVDFSVALTLEIVYKIRNPGSWTGWAPGRPYGPGNLSNFSDIDMVYAAIDQGLALPLLSGPNPIIIPIGCGAFYLVGDYRPPSCPEWP